MKRLKSDQITKIIDEALVGIENSKLGALFINRELNQVNIVAFNVMMAVVSSQLPQRSIAEMTEPPESWQRDDDSDFETDE